MGSQRVRQDWATLRERESEHLNGSILSERKTNKAKIEGYYMNIWLSVYKNKNKLLISYYKALGNFSKIFKDVGYKIKVQ